LLSDIFLAKIIQETLHDSETLVGK
jgi:hypothetical protein